MIKINRLTGEITTDIRAEAAAFLLENICRNADVNGILEELKEKENENV
jgi:hypothetical protein